MKTKIIKKDEVLLVSGLSFTINDALEMGKKSKAKLTIYCPDGVEKAVKYMSLNELENLLKRTIKLCKKENH